MPIRTFPARFEFLDEIRDFVAEIARHGGFTEKEIYSLQLAADEAASNIVEHAYMDVQDGEIRISCDMRGNDIIIAMHDDGRSFNPNKVKAPNLKADLSERQIGGLGIYLMRKLMDDVRYESKPGAGNLLTMRKRKG
ncbi:MAG: ATP-binding protein [Chloroflexota bacterium]